MSMSNCVKRALRQAPYCIYLQCQNHNERSRLIRSLSQNLSPRPTPTQPLYHSFSLVTSLFLTHTLFHSCSLASPSYPLSLPRYCPPPLSPSLSFSGPLSLSLTSLLLSLPVSSPLTLSHPTSLSLSQSPSIYLCF